MLDVGEKLPNVAVTDDTGAQIATHDLFGKPLVLWFYPKDDTPG